MTKRYGMEIYKPSSDETVWSSFASDTPFIVPRVGDTIAPVNVEDDRGGQLVEVIHVTHMFWEAPEGFTKQKTLVYTRRLAVGSVRDLIKGTR